MSRFASQFFGRAGNGVIGRVLDVIDVGLLFFLFLILFVMRKVVRTVALLRIRLCRVELARLFLMRANVNIPLYQFIEMQMHILPGRIIVVAHYRCVMRNNQTQQANYYGKTDVIENWRDRFHFF